MNEAIKLAIEKGGYFTKIAEYDWGLYDAINDFVLDPLFWQALGKALGWTRENYFEHTSPISGLKTFSGVMETWKYQAHQFLDARFEGTEEEFWKALLNKE